MSFLGSKNKRLCKFCQKKVELVKEFGEFYCQKCDRFQTEEFTEEVKTLQILRLNNYSFNAQKYSYTIYNELGSKIAQVERRDLTKICREKNYNIKYLFFNDVKRIIARMDGNLANDSKTQNGSWKIYDYGSRFRGEICYSFENDSWIITNPDCLKVALLHIAENRKSKFETLREFDLVNPDDPHHKLFQVVRKGSFNLSILDDFFDTHLAWGFVIALHRKYFT